MARLEAARQAAAAEYAAREVDARAEAGRHTAACRRAAQELAALRRAATLELQQLQAATGVMISSQGSGPLRDAECVQEPVRVPSATTASPAPAAALAAPRPLPLPPAPAAKPAQAAPEVAALAEPRTVDASDEGEVWFDAVDHGPSGAPPHRPSSRRRGKKAARAGNQCCCIM